MRAKAPVALACVVALAWAWLLAGAGVGMEAMDMGGGGMMLMRPEWTVGYAARVFGMWIVMMAAMMLPGAGPAIAGAASPVFFSAGYLSIWGGFSLAAALAQFTLDRSDLLSDAMAVNSGALAGALIVATGLYQLTPWKRACLRGCATAAASQDRIPGGLESARRGLQFGVSCLGCCWALMALLFVAGVMNLLWVAAIALWVSAEKLLPRGGSIARLAGAGLIAWGSVRLALAVL